MLLNVRQSLVRDFLLAMTTMSGDKDEKINVARYYADEVILDKPANLSTTVRHNSGANSTAYAVTSSRGTGVMRREKENLEGAFK